MTQQQFDRWQEFALAMAERGFRGRTPARNEKRTEQVRQFFRCVASEADYSGKLPDWRNWDQGLQDDGGRYQGICLASYFDEWSEGLPGYWQLSPRHYEDWGFQSEIHCCLRAGMDLACEPSAGVLGFTVGDLRRMFSPRLPDWVVTALDPQILLEDDRTSCRL